VVVGEEMESNVGDVSNGKSGWEEVIDTLSSWADDVTVLEDEGIIPPSYPIVRKALGLSHTLMARGWAPPLRVVPNADGGIVFEHGIKEQFEEVEIYADGSMEFIAFEDSKIVVRRPLIL